MNRALRAIAVMVLAVLVVGGWVGGLGFVTDPSGARLGMTMADLPPWPLLDDYTIPGILLLLLFGLLPVGAAVLLIRRSAGGWAAAAGVGLVLVMWMLGQFVAIGLTFPAMQLGFLAVGAVLAAVGYLGYRRTDDPAGSTGTSRR